MAVLVTGYHVVACSLGLCKIKEVENAHGGSLPNLVDGINLVE